MDLRHEWKHRINVEDLILLRQRLRLLAKPDPYAVGGCYHIRSLYFDTPSDKALREKLDGVNGREKFRIRCYNRDFSLIHLEKKSKRNGLGRKEKVRLTPDQVQAQSVIFCGQFIHAILFCSLLLRLLSFDFSLRIFLAQAGQYLDAPEPGTYSTPHTVQFLAGIAAHRFVGMICNSSTKPMNL